MGTVKMHQVALELECLRKDPLVESLGLRFLICKIGACITEAFSILRI